MTKAAKQYIADVREALNLSDVKKLSKSEYLACLEEIWADLDGMLEAVREELEEELAEAEK